MIFLMVKIRFLEIELNDDSDSENSMEIKKEEQSNRLGYCNVCLRTLGDGKVKYLSCCGNNIHSMCLKFWLPHNPVCPCCRQIFTAETSKLGQIRPFVSRRKQNKGGGNTKQKERNKREMDRDVIRNEARLKKQRRQVQQSEKMIKLRVQSVNIEMGSVVTLKMDYRDVSHARGIMGIVFDISKSEAGGIQVMTEYGIICTGTGKAKYYVPIDGYVVQEEDVWLEKALEDVRARVRNGTFDAYNEKRLTMQRAHAAMVGYSPAV